LVPAADTGTTLITIIEFVGQSAFAGLIGAAALEIYNQLKVKLLKFVRRDLEEANRHRFFDKLVIRFDDLDIGIFMANEEVLEKLPDILNDIGVHLSRFPLNGSPVNTLLLPMERIGTNWRASSTVWSKGTLEYPFRYWWISSRDVAGVTGVYDSRDCKIIENYLSDNDFLKVLLDAPYPIAIGNSQVLVQMLSSIRHQMNLEELDELTRNIECLAYVLNLDVGDGSAVNYVTVKHLLQINDWLKSFANPIEALAHLMKQTPK
jgi:hypothetical protein